MRSPRLHSLFYPALLSGALAFGAIGCGDDDDGEPSPPADQTDTGGGGDDTPEVDPSCPGEALQQDSVYRVTSVTIEQPTGVGGPLGDLMNADFASQDLHILIQLSSFEDACDAPTELQITGNAGQLLDSGEYTWADEIDDIEYRRASLSADGTLVHLETLSLIFPAILPETDPPEIIRIPIRELGIEAEVGLDSGTRFMAGVLTGGIIEEEVRDLQVALNPDAPSASLPALLGRNRMNYPAGSDEPTGWQIRVEFIAVDVDFTE